MQAQVLQQPLVAVHAVVAVPVLLHRHVGEVHLDVVQLSHLCGQAGRQAGRRANQTGVLIDTMIGA
jgi:hypothetical protein